MNVLLSLIFSLLLVVSLCFGVLAFLIFRKYKEIERELYKFISPVDEKTPSPLTQVYDQLMERGSKIFGTGLKASLMGSISGVARQAKGIEADVVQDLAQGQSPVLAGLMNSFPSLSKRLSKNPGLIQALLPLFANLGAPGNNGKSKAVEPYDINRFGG